MAIRLNAHWLHDNLHAKTNFQINLKSSMRWSLQLIGEYFFGGFFLSMVVCNGLKTNLLHLIFIIWVSHPIDDDEEKSTATSL